MHVTVVKLTLMLDDIHSLKAKRNTIRPIIEKVKSRHNVSISEISLQDDFKVSILGITYVSNSSTNNLKIINKVLDRKRRNSFRKVLEHQVSCNTSGHIFSTTSSDNAICYQRTQYK